MIKLLSVFTNFETVHGLLVCFLATGAQDLEVADANPATDGTDFSYITHLGHNANN